MIRCLLDQDLLNAFKNILQLGFPFPPQRRLQHLFWNMLVISLFHNNSYIQLLPFFIYSLCNSWIDLPQRSINSIHNADEQSKICHILPKLRPFRILTTKALLVLLCHNSIRPHFCVPFLCTMILMEWKTKGVCKVKLQYIFTFFFPAC